MCVVSIQCRIPANLLVCMYIYGSLDVCSLLQCNVNWGVQIMALSSRMQEGMYLHVCYG